MSNLSRAKALYDAFARGDMKKLIAAMAEDMTWSEAHGMAFGGEFTGPTQVVENILVRIPDLYKDFRIEFERLVDGGDTIVMVGWYHGRGRRTGCYFKVRAMHAITFNAEGRVSRVVQCADTAIIEEALG